MVKSWIRRAPKPERFPRYRIEDQNGNYVAEVEIHAHGRAFDAATAITYLPQLISAAQDVVDAAGEHDTSKAVKDLRDLLALIPRQLDTVGLGPVSAADIAR